MLDPRISFSPINPTGMYGRVEVVTPEMAAQWLVRMVPNRNLRLTRLESYCKSRIEGRWTLTHQGVAFNTRDELFDGHHRLQMIVKTGLPTTLFVVRNVPDEALLHTDEQLPRSVRDAINFAGDGDYSHGLIAVASCLQFLPRTTKGSGFLGRDAIQVILKTHPLKLDFSHKQLGRVKSVTRAVRALVARAWSYVKDTRLEEFCSILRDGVTISPDSKQDRAAVIYRNYLLEKKGSDAPAEVERYRKGQCALKHFLARNALCRIGIVEEDLYPLKDENGDAGEEN